MATKLANQEEESQGSTKMKKNLDNWKYPKIPVDQVYKKKRFEMFRKYAIKDCEKTMTLKSSNQNVSVQLTSGDFLKGFIKKHHKFLHLGLVQIAIKPLVRDGLGAPIVVCLRDARHLNFKNSLLAVVECDLSQGSFYFNCFPSFSVALNDDASLKALTLNVKTGGMPLALTYRLVCKATVSLNIEAFQEPTLGETTYFQARSGASSTTKWDEVQVPEDWIRTEEPQKRSVVPRFTFSNGRVMYSVQSSGDANGE